MQYFPLFMDLKNKPVLVVGGGEVASRKVETLHRAGAHITIVSPEISATLIELVESGECYWVEKEYDSSDMKDKYCQIWATTDDSELNHRVHADAKALRIMVNVVDDKPYCDFITPSIINRGKIQIAISSGGSSPVLIRNVREQVETILPQNLSLLADFAQAKRDEIKAAFASVAERRMFWERFFADPILKQVTTIEELSARYRTALSAKGEVTVSRFFVEFGSDVELLSIKALRLMQSAELVLYPIDCPFEFVDLCRRDAERTRFDSCIDLNEKLSLVVKDEIKSVCVFVPKSGATLSEYHQIVGENLLLRVTG